MAGFKYPEVKPSKDLGGIWYGKLRSGERKSLLDRLVNATEETVDVLAGKIALPPKIYVGFHDSDEWANAFNRTIRLGELAPLILGTKKPSGQAKGLLGHELSHVSDFASKNDCVLGETFSHRAVEEGKADAVGMVVGGEHYISEHCVVLSRPRHKVVAYSVICSTQLTDNNMRLHNGNILNAEEVGLSLVLDVVERTNAEGIFPIHAEGFEFYRRHAQSLVEQLGRVA